MRLILCLCIIAIPALVKKPEATHVNHFSMPRVMLKDGDLVMRSGKGLISDIFKKTSARDQQYSHAGILVYENNKPFVYHMIGSQVHHKTGYVKESLASFCNSSNNTGFGIYRLSVMENKNNEIRRFFNRLDSVAPVFDEHFDLVTEDALYCSEMIYKLVLAVSGTKLQLAKLKNQDYMPLDNLYLHPESKLITTLNYQN